MSTPSPICVGDRFGHVVVIATAGARGGHRLWALRCDCGGTPKPVKAQALRSGSTKSCGCMRRKRFLAMATKHGHAANERKTPELTAWQHMKSRCYDENFEDFKDYGGRGIVVADCWLHDFKAFLAYIGSRPSPRCSVDRIDPNGNYAPGNVRWATSKQQGRNKRNTIWVTIHGQRIPLAEAIERFAAVEPNTVRSRIGRGMDHVQAILRPPSRIVRRPEPT